LIESLRIVRAVPVRGRLFCLWSRAVVELSGVRIETIPRVSVPDIHELDRNDYMKLFEKEDFSQIRLSAKIIL